MGNLSCVSCKVKDKKFKTTTELGLSDFKGASFNNDVVSMGQTTTAAPTRQPQQQGEVPEPTINDVIPSSGHLTDPDQLDLNIAAEARRGSMAEMCEVIRSNRLKDESDDHLDDVEKAAQAIVSMTVFVASQVIYPAYMRYLEEDHPEVYQQYVCRPITPSPCPEEQQLIVNGTPG